MKKALDVEILGRFLAAVGNDLVRDNLSFVERGQSGALHGGDVDEHVLAAALGLDESIALGRIEPLHSALSHRSLQKVDRAPYSSHAGVPTGDSPIIEL